MNKVSEKIDQMFANFDKLEKNLDTIAKLQDDNKCETENGHLKTKIRDLENYIDSLHQMNNNTPTNKGESKNHSKINSVEPSEEQILNFTHTRILSDVNLGMANLEQYGYNKETPNNNTSNAFGPNANSNIQINNVNIVNTGGTRSGSFVAISQNRNYSKNNSHG